MYIRTGRRKEERPEQEVYFLNFSSAENKIDNVQPTPSFVRDSLKKTKKQNKDSNVKNTMNKICAIIFYVLYMHEMRYVTLLCIISRDTVVYKTYPPDIKEKYDVCNMIFCVALVIKQRKHSLYYTINCV